MRVLVRGRVRVRSQEATGVNPQYCSCLPKGHKGGHKGECCFRLVLGPRPDNFRGLCSVRSQESPQVGAALPWKRYGDVPGSMSSDPVLLLDPCAWCCQTLVLGRHGERALASVRVRSRDVARAEATLVS